MRSSCLVFSRDSSLLPLPILASLHLLTDPFAQLSVPLAAHLSRLFTMRPNRVVETSTDRNVWLDPEDVASAVLYAVTAPNHVGINEILIEPRDAPA